MIVVYMTLRLHAPWCNSLKDKRAHTRRLMAGLRAKFNLSVCESDEQDIHRITVLAMAALAFDSAQADAIAQSVSGWVASNTEAEILDFATEYR